MTATDDEMTAPQQAALSKWTARIDKARAAGKETLRIVNDKALSVLPDDIRHLTGLRHLELSQTAVSDLAPIADLSGLRTLSLDDTDIEDLTPLAGMRDLQVLVLNRTAVTDIAPLQNLSSLRALYLADTPIGEISPIANLSSLRALNLVRTDADLRQILALDTLWENAGRDGPQEPYWGLWFTGLKATHHDPELHRLSHISDAAPRAQQTRAYLRTLPPWPEALAWESAADVAARLPAPRVSTTSVTTGRRAETKSGAVESTAGKSTAPESTAGKSTAAESTAVKSAAKEPLVFLSFAERDRSEVADLRALLLQRQIPVWWSSDIVPGETVSGETFSGETLSGANRLKVTNEKLAECAIVLTIWSAHSVKSERVFNDADEARRLSKLMQISLDGTDAPLIFRGKPLLDMSAWDKTPTHDSFEKLVLDLNALLGRDPVA